MKLKNISNILKSSGFKNIELDNIIGAGNAKFDLSSKKNLVELNSRIENIDLIENVFVQEFNKDYVNLKIKYLGKLDKIIKQLRSKNIVLKLINEQWIITTLK